MRLTTLLLGTILSLSTVPVMAGSGHDHGPSRAPVSQNTATINATRIVADLVESNKLDKSWASIIPGSAEKKVFKGNPEWVIVLVNDKITDPAKRTLYVFLTSGGEYIAANYTGE